MMNFLTNSEKDRAAMGQNIEQHENIDLIQQKNRR